MGPCTFGSFSCRIDMQTGSFYVLSWGYSQHCSTAMQRATPLATLQSKLSDPDGHVFHLQTMRAHSAEGPEGRDERMRKREAVPALPMTTSPSGTGPREPFSIPVATAQPQNADVPRLQHTRSVPDAPRERGDATRMERSYSLPVATHDEHQERLRTAHYEGHYWWTGGWTACGNGMLEFAESEERQTNTRTTVAQTPATLPPIPASPEQITRKRDTWSPQVTRKRKSVSGARDDTMLPDDDATPDNWPCAWVAVEPKIPAHIITATRGSDLPGIVARVPESLGAQGLPHCTPFTPLYELGEL